MTSLPPGIRIYPIVISEARWAFLPKYQRLIRVQSSSYWCRIVEIWRVCVITRKWVIWGASLPHDLTSGSEIKWTCLHHQTSKTVVFRMAGLDSEMEKEIDDLRRRYHAKRQPILDAMDQKRKRQQNFWSSWWFLSLSSALSILASSWY